MGSRGTVRAAVVEPLGLGCVSALLGRGTRVIEHVHVLENHAARRMDRANMLTAGCHEGLGFNEASIFADVRVATFARSRAGVQLHAGRKNATQGAQFNVPSAMHIPRNDG